MKYIVTLDSRGYVTNIAQSRHGFVELNLDEYDLADGKIRAYKLGKNRLIFDEEEWQRIQDANQHEADLKEIAELEKKLADTDYIFAEYCEELLALDNALTWVADVIKLNIRYMKTYAETIKNRKAWRKRIEELRND